MLGNSMKPSHYYSHKRTRVLVSLGERAESPSAARSCAHPSWQNNDARTRQSRQCHDDDILAAARRRRRRWWWRWWWWLLVPRRCCVCGAVLLLTQMCRFVSEDILNTTTEFPVPPHVHLSRFHFVCAMRAYICTLLRCCECCSPVSRFLCLSFEMTD